MSLKELTLEGEIDRIQVAIERLKTFEPPEGYYLAFSGGKDSIVLKKLADMAKIKYDAHFNLTSVDPKEVILFTRKYHPDVILEKPEKTMWKLIPEHKLPPTRIARYCCQYLKERGGSGRFVLTGNRKSESYKRSKRKMIETCFKDGSKKYLHPIIDWKDGDIWEFIRKFKMPYCELYDQGQKRIGCIMCPMGGPKGMLRDKEKFPGHYKAYLKAFEKMLIELDKSGKPHIWKNAEEVMKWWIYNPGKKKQERLFD